MFTTIYPYSLSPSEVVLLESHATWTFPEDAADPAFAFKPVRCELVITNQAIVLNGFLHRFFSSDSFLSAQIGLDQILWHNEMPHIVQKEDHLKIQCISELLDLKFSSSEKAAKARNILLNQMTGTTAWQRTLETVGEKTADVVSQFAKTAGTLIDSFRSSRSSPAHHESPSALQSHLEQLEALRQAGILTQEEYDEKRRQILDF